MKVEVVFLILAVCFFVPGTLSNDVGYNDRTFYETYDYSNWFDWNSYSYSDSNSGGSGSSGNNDDRPDEKLSTPEECARTCVRGEKPKTCYYHFRAEIYGTMTKACNLCRPNATTQLTGNCQCIQADGYEMSGIKVVNRMLPGPSILVCLNDYVVIDVDNAIHGNEITIHWHGIYQNGYQYYDGVPYVTQCPISEGTKFRYQWKAKNSGTHFWHSHTGLQKSDGLKGAIIVREPKETEYNNQYWDEDNIDNIIFLTDLFHTPSEAHYPGNYNRTVRQIPANFLINGVGQWTDPDTGNTTTIPLATLNVVPGRRNRFRMINACSLTCPISLAIQGHNMTVIATDGEPIVPVVVSSISSVSAERYDFVINATQKSDNYWIQVLGLAECLIAKRSQVGILRYQGALASEPMSSRPTSRSPLPQGQILNKFNVACNGSAISRDNICVQQLRSIKPVPSRVVAKNPDLKFYLPFGFFYYVDRDLFRPGTYQPYIVPTQDAELISTIGRNLTFTTPASALISQRNDIPEDQLCTIEKAPARCRGKNVCSCTVIEEIPLNSVVEVIVFDTEDVQELSHPFHLHGGFFYVLAEGVASDFNLTTLNLSNVKDIDRRNLIKRNFNSPPPKDTHAVYNKGFTVIRFLAINPGYWFYHCHFEFHLATGMALVFHVGSDGDLPPKPRNFPKCGNFVPPIGDP